MVLLSTFTVYHIKLEQVYKIRINYKIMTFNISIIMINYYHYLKFISSTVRYYVDCKNTVQKVKIIKSSTRSDDVHHGHLHTLSTYAEDLCHRSSTIQRYNTYLILFHRFRPQNMLALFSTPIQHNCIFIDIDSHIIWDFNQRRTIYQPNGKFQSLNLWRSSLKFN